MFEYLRNGVLDSLGVFAGDDYLLAGSLFLVMFPVWVKGADLYYKCNDMVMGHFYMVFGITFAGLVGIGYIVLFFSHVIPGWTMDERFFGVIYLVGGAFLIPTLPSLMYMDKVNMVTWFLCTVWLINGGIYYFYYSTVLYVINIICCCLVAVGITYMMLNEAYLMSYGKSLPMGKLLREFPVLQHLINILGGTENDITNSGICNFCGHVSLDCDRKI